MDRGHGAFRRCDHGVGVWVPHHGDGQRRAGSTPENCVDPIVAAIKIHEALETLMSREKSPIAEAVLTIGKFQAGDAANVIPEQAGKSACCQEIFSASSAVAPGERGVPDAVSGANGPFGHHTPRVRFNEDYLPQAATIYAASALNWLANHSR